MASEYLKWKYRDVRPDPVRVMTRRERAANWWHYHRWGLLAGALVLLALGDILFHALGFGRIEPDYQLAFVVDAMPEEGLLQDLAGALEGLGEDLNGDGRVTLRINAYIIPPAAGDGDAARYAAATQARLMADLEACDSYFFICDDPETLHENYDILADARGDIAGPGEAIDARRWEDCPVLSALDVNQAQMAGLYLARRGFWGDRVCRYRAGCDDLFDKLTEGSKSP